MTNQNFCNLLDVNEEKYDSHIASGFKEALDIISTSKQDFMIFPMDPVLFGFDIKIDLSSYEDVDLSNDNSEDEIESQYYYSNEFATIVISTLDQAPYEFAQYLKNIGNNDEVSHLLSSKLFENFVDLSNIVGSQYQIKFKAISTRGAFVDWHKDRNECDEVYDHAEYNIVIALTRPGTWFCDVSMGDRFLYDNSAEINYPEFEQKCESDFLYEVPEFSGVIFRACDDYAAVHANPAADQRLISLIELIPIESI